MKTHRYIDRYSLSFLVPFFFPAPVSSVITPSDGQVYREYLEAVLVLIVHPVLLHVCNIIYSMHGSIVLRKQNVIRFRISSCLEL